jgi:hypothetical protein
MLSQVELAYSAPTINVMWRIAHALEVPFSALLASEGAKPTQILRGREAKILTSHDAKFSSRALFPVDAPRRSGSAPTTSETGLARSRRIKRSM